MSTNNNLYFQKNASNSIGSISNLANALNLTVNEIVRAVNLPNEVKYTANPQQKADGSQRMAYNPHRYLRKVQRRINKRIFADPSVVSWPDYIFGSVPNTTLSLSEVIKKDYVSCAARHCLAKSLLRLDIKDFFPNIGEHLVRAVFEDFYHFPPDVSEILVSLCTKDGGVPQGALTSGYLACLCLFDVEPEVVRRIEMKGLTYTRYVDDIVVSSKVHDHNFSLQEKLISSMLEDKDLPVNDTKTLIQRSSTAPLIVHGLRVSFKEPRLPSDEVRRIRSAVRNLEKQASEPNFRTTRVFRSAHNRCVGKVNKLKRVGHKQHSEYLRRLNLIKPLARRSDVERVVSMIRRLENDHGSISDTYAYHKRYFRAHERLNIIQRNYENIAFKLRQRLKSIPSNYVK
ncbi:reverse transcriptase family protein [Salinicola aestuarinus]|uniref:reverse transcriptase family protein n=1 Tax=Salinicola aestuarinus TaxID=1949082 RepID=UPI000DA253B4|nr:reverse transcriptase family protein [Salinicola aestuarinus]